MLGEFSLVLLMENNLNLPYYQLRLPIFYGAGYNRPFDAMYLRLCGWSNDPVNPCTCPPTVVTKYQKLISGPLPDCLDTACRIEVPRVDYEKLSGDRMGESSEIIRALSKPHEIFKMSVFRIENQKI